MSIRTKEEKYPFGASGTAYPTVANLQFKMERATIINGVWFNDGNQTYYPAVVAGNSLVAKIQDSDDGIAWGDVGATIKTTVPMGQQAFTAVVKKYWRVLAYGGTSAILKVDVDQTLDTIKI